MNAINIISPYRHHGMWVTEGGRNSDPFIIARAAVEGRTVVTMELFKVNAAKNPNICRHFSVHLYDA